MAEAETDIVAWLHEKVRVCDIALANLPPRGDSDRSQIERAIRDVRADAVRELRARGHDIGDAAAL